MEVSKFPWQLSIYDNVTGDLILHDPWNYSPVSWCLAASAISQYSADCFQKQRSIEMQLKGNRAEYAQRAVKVANAS